MATIVKRPSGKWQATVRKDGQSRSKSFVRRADAAKWARETELKAERGELAQAFHLDVPTMTLCEVLTRYRDVVTSTKRCADNERYAIDGFIRNNPTLTKQSLHSLSSTDFAIYRDKRMVSVKAATVVRELGWIQHALDVACADWGQHLPEGNPVKPVRRPKIDNRRERRLREGEWQSLLSSINEARSPLMKPLLVLALATGMRRGELLSMQWRHVDLVRRTVFLPRTKNGSARTVPLSPKAVAQLASLPRTDTQCLPMTGNSVRLAFERIRKRAGIVDLTFHDLRHEAVSRFIESGLSLAQVQMISGHRDLRMLMRYTHLQTADIVAKLADIEAN